MRVRLNTKPKQHYTSKEWESFHEAIQFFIDRYNLDKFKWFDLTVDLDAELPRLTYGQFTPRVDRYGGRIELRRTKKIRRMIETLFHELQHVRQSVENQMTYVAGHVLWEGRPVLKESSANTIDYYEYHKLPWEVDARLVASQTLKEWLNLPQNKRTWIDYFKSWF